MSEIRTVRLWYIRQTDKARLYSKLPPSRNPGPADQIWIPHSVVEGRTIYPTGEHHLRIQEWFCEKEGL